MLKKILSVNHITDKKKMYYNFVFQKGEKKETVNERRRKKTISKVK